MVIECLLRQQQLQRWTEHSNTDLWKFMQLLRCSNYVEMIFWWSLLVSNFQISVWECYVHSCSCPCLRLLVPEDAPIIDRLPLQSALGLWVTPGTNTDFLHWLQSWLPIEAEYELVPNGLWVCKHYIGGQPKVWYRKYWKECRTSYNSNWYWENSGRQLTFTQ